MIELGSSQHGTNDAIEYDSEQTKFFRGFGFNSAAPILKREDIFTYFIIKII